MAPTTPFVPALQGASLWQRLDAARAALAQRAAQRRLYRTTLAELGALSDRDLADLGLHRSEIRAVASEAVLRA